MKFQKGKYFLITAYIFFICPCPSFSQKKPDSTLIKLNAEIVKLNKDPFMKKAKWGICVLTADSGTTVTEFHADTGLIPASTMKAITTAAALSMLGKDYTFKTYLIYDGDIDTAGVLHGNIYIKGGGDPSLGSPRIDSMMDMKYLLPEWVMNVKKLGIKKIEGTIAGDASIFDDTICPPAWLDGDKGLYYGAGASGLNFHENAFRIILKSGKYYRDSARVAELDPPIPYMTVKNKVSTGTVYTAEDTWIFGKPYDNLRTVKGWIPYSKEEFPQRASLPDPAFFCAYSFFKCLKDSGIVASDSCTTLKMLKESGKLKKSRSLTVFYSMKSEPLDTIIYYTNQYSLNSWAESILKILAYEKTGTGSTYNGTQLVTNFWKSKGVDLKGFAMKDGSGLSQSNDVSPRHLASIMRAFMDDSLYAVFYHSLPLAGRSGTISKIFKGTVAENNLRAKSGYMRGMRSYTGYVKNKNGRVLTFGIIVNGHAFTADKMRSMLEKIMVLIAETDI